MAKVPQRYIDIRGFCTGIQVAESLNNEKVNVHFFEEGDRWKSVIVTSFEHDRYSYNYIYHNQLVCSVDYMKAKDEVWFKVILRCFSKSEFNQKHNCLIDEFKKIGNFEFSFDIPKSSSGTYVIGVKIENHHSLDQLYSLYNTFKNLEKRNQNDDDDEDFFINVSITL